MDRLLTDVLMAALIVLISFFSYRTKKLSLAASLLAFAVAFVLYLTGGFLFFTLLMVFFFSSTLISKFGVDRRRAETKIHQKHGTRDVVQVAANAGAATVMAVLFALFGQEQFTLACVAALSACTADTWASEVGILSKRVPVSILTLKPVMRGISGGITLLGLMSSFAGSALIAGIYVLFRLSSLPLLTLAVNSFIIVLSGLAGSVLDSIMGDLLQAKYISAETGDLTEKPCENDVKNRLIKGFAFITNDAVNLLSSLTVAVTVLFIRV